MSESYPKLTKVFNSNPFKSYFVKRLISELLNTNDSFDTSELIKLLHSEGRISNVKPIIQDKGVQEALELAIIQIHQQFGTGGTDSFNLKEKLDQVISNIFAKALKGKNKTELLHPLLFLNLINKYSNLYTEFIQRLKTEYIPILLKKYPQAIYYIPQEIREEIKSSEEKSTNAANWYQIAKFAEKNL